MGTEIRSTSNGQPRARDDMHNDAHDARRPLLLRRAQPLSEQGLDEGLVKQRFDIATLEDLLPHPVRGAPVLHDATKHTRVGGETTDDD